MFILQAWRSKKLLGVFIKKNVQRLNQKIFIQSCLDNFLDRIKRTKLGNFLTGKQYVMLKKSLKIKNKMMLNVIKRMNFKS